MDELFKDFANATNDTDRSSKDRVQTIQSDVVFWSIIDGILVITILGGNTLTILAVRFCRRLRSIISNMFILSLAISDMVVGFTLPYHLAFYMGYGLGKNHCWCLLRFFLIILACCVSIWNLIAIAFDRYIAIVYPLHYSRFMTRKIALILLSIGWIMGSTIAAIPMFWNNWDTATECEFDEVLPPWYMAGVITPVFSMVWLCLLLVYWRIWREAAKQVKQMRSSFSSAGVSGYPSDWKSVQVVLLILGCFSICWLPYFIVACTQIFHLIEESSPKLYKGAFSLAMANSGMNPLIYAWKNTNFRRAFGCLLRCKSPNSHLNENEVAGGNIVNNGGGVKSSKFCSNFIKRKCTNNNNHRNNNDDDDHSDDNRFSPSFSTSSSSQSNRRNLQRNRENSLETISSHCNDVVVIITEPNQQIRNSESSIKQCSNNGNLIDTDNSLQTNKSLMSLDYYKCKNLKIDNQTQNCNTSTTTLTENI